ncbi:hypothetical protein N7448_003785 [Penicillium atrosanguineum]|uniref:Uncharacterized protein n=1 Tax=Penicillium atrosanguineum TaxID=1132637 RepID=A0A9W9H7Z1_9EURO|nr:uncharacterized protein N7443_002752 [Penicillium atrosanguineum]KAJ5122651.1 hypothetical protein N7526_009588 [Penicillium atrosanguineum]KAJ5140377.1 hypothetical protein N7448_003785 [Penicillium atrosanguineum]KAJ5310291.1 hypothetical protein N7443_002752 [Penicillium atrosanguineum]KAJ5315809.1 hypothetical protein N7476_006116 [Penicillium atrosanguineum]
MKSPLYILAVLLPLANELALASPTAEPVDFDALEERNGGGGGGGHGKGDFNNPCRIRNQYWYWKYPCDSSDRKGQAFPGGQFSASCRYKNWYQTQNGWVRNSDKPQGCSMFFFIRLSKLCLTGIKDGNWEHSC